MKTQIVYREDRKIEASDSVCDLHVRGTIVMLGDMLVFDRDRCVLVIELAGRWRSLSEDDQEGERLTTTHEIEKVTVVRNALVAPRTAVEAANVWFADAPGLLAGKARAEAAQALAEESRRKELAREHGANTSYDERQG